MKERPVDLERAIVAHHQAPEIAQPRVGALDNATTLIAPQRSPVLRGRTNAILLVRTDQLDPATSQAIPQRIAIVGFVSDHTHGFLSRSPRMVDSAYADRRERRFREPDFRRGCRVKVVSQRKTAAVDHHHPLRPLAPLGFPDSSAPFFRWSKTAVQKRLAPLQLLALVQ